MSSFLCSCCLLGAILMLGDSANFLIFREKFKRPWALRLSLAYGLGTGALGLLLFYLSYAGLKIEAATIALIVLPFAGVFLYRCVRCFSCPRQALQPKKRLHNGLIEYLLYLVIAISLAIVLTRALLLPLHLPDDRTQWGLKAKMLYYEKTIALEALFDPDRMQLHLGYPFLIPLIEASFFCSMAEMNDQLVKLPFAAYFICLLLFFYAAQKEFASHRHALLCTAMLAVLPTFIEDVSGNPSSGYADLPLAFYYFIAVVGLVRWLNSSQRHDLTLAAVFATFAIFTKQEGLYMWAFMVAAGAVMLAADPGKRLRGRFRAFAAFVLAPLIALAPWFYFKSTFILSPWDKDWSLAQFAPAYIMANLDRVAPILGAFRDTFFTATRWNWLWSIFFCLLLLYPKQSLKSPCAPVLLLVLCNVLAVFAAVVLYPWPWWGNFTGDMHRVLLSNIPLIAFFISFQMQQLLKQR